MSKKWASLLSCILVVCIMVIMMPMTVFASGTNGSTLTTDIGEKTFTVGVPVEFTFTTTAGNDAGKMVNGTAIFSNPDVIEKLEYYEVKDGNWYEFTGDFGAPSGFPMSDATSRFRVTFKEAGEYTFTASMVEVGTENVLCSTEVTFTVDEYEQSTLTTDIEDKTFTVGVPTEFTFTTIAGDDAGKMVNGTAIFSNPDVIEKLEYYEVKDGNWYELTGDFGPSTGFPMSDATSRFRVTFKEAGEYTFTASMVEVGTENVLCSTEVTFTVNAQEDPGTDDPGIDEPGDNPETGDNSNIVIWTLLLFVSGAILTGIVIYGRKAKYNR